MRLSSKVALVTGGASGFGAGICRRFAEEGARLVLVDRDHERGAALARELDAALVEADVASSADAQRMIAATTERFGRLDILVNNAGTPQPPTSVVDTTEAEFDRLMAVNARAIFLAAKHAVPVMRRQGGGVILSTVSVAAVRPRPGLAAYNASKGAALVLTKSLAIELAPDRIRVNAVCPGPGDTPMLATFVGGESEAHRAAFLSSIPLGRLCTPADVAAAMVFLASDEASFITGAVLEVDGGRGI
ncbi:MAG TPA: SDR family oxidoreductase [Vicinamibacterales bacterium]|jgi:3-oxoacyl-[acyl-carrier protein] reductase|nr:SDR family oxidoreductase [Vicinamibacterales bacterium]